jgi:hypothetical protein
VDPFILSSPTQTPPPHACRNPLIPARRAQFGWPSSACRSRARRRWMRRFSPKRFASASTTPQRTDACRRSPCPRRRHVPVHAGCYRAARLGERAPVGGPKRVSLPLGCSAGAMLLRATSLPQEIQMELRNVFQSTPEGLEVRSKRARALEPSTRACTALLSRNETRQIAFAGACVRCDRALRRLRGARVRENGGGQDADGHLSDCGRSGCLLPSLV